MSEPRTTREALIAQILGDLDGLITRIEQLPKAIAEAEIRLAAASRVLNDAGDKYRLAVTAFTEEAKTTLTEYLERKASHLVALTVEEHRAIIKEVARSVYQPQGSSGVTQNRSDWNRPTSEDPRRPRCRLLEHGVTAALASVLTAVLVFLIVAFC